MDRPRIFLGSSKKQAKLLEVLTRGLEDIARIEPWTTSFNPGTSTLERLLELTREVDFAIFVFAQDDWTDTSPPASPGSGSGQAAPRDNVVFEAGLFGGVLGMRRTFILHSRTAKLPSDLLGLTCIRYGDAATAAEVRAINDKLRKAIENEGRATRVEGLWWQFSLTERSAQEPSAVSLLQVSRDRDGVLALAGRSWQEDGRLSARYWSEAAKEKNESSGLFYYWNGERPLDAKDFPGAPAENLVPGSLVFTMTSGPVGLADTNSSSTRAPLPASLRPYSSPAARTSCRASAHHAGERNTLRKPGPAISTRSTTAVFGNEATMASAILRGGRRASRARVMATLVA